MTEGYECRTLVAVEDPFARASIYSFAASEYEEARDIHRELHQRRLDGFDRMYGVDRKPIEPLAEFGVFLDQSRDLRIRRERDATYYNDSTKH